MQNTQSNSGLHNRFRRQGSDSHWANLFRSFGLTVIEFDSEIEVNGRKFSVAMFIEDWNCFAMVQNGPRDIQSEAIALNKLVPEFDVLVLAPHPYGSTDQVRMFSQKVPPPQIDWRLKQVFISGTTESALMLFDGNHTLYSPAINWMGSVSAEVTLRTPAVASTSVRYF